MKSHSKKVVPTDEEKKYIQLHIHCTNIPKIELHAHLNGCIRPNTFMELALKYGVDLDDLDSSFGKNLESCFKTFSYIHKVTNNLEAIHRITMEMIEDFQQQNVIYAEIRTSPKKIGQNTKKDYIQTVINAMEESKNKYPSITTRLLVSINRGSDSIQDAQETLESVLQLKSQSPYIVGFEFCGRPDGKNFIEFKPVFEKAKENGLPITLHCGEIDNYEDSEEIIAFHPDRIGHGYFLKEEQVDKIINLKIPVELCPSSYFSRTPTANEIPNFRKLFENQNPLALCVDDTCLFNTNASNERFEFLLKHKLGMDDLKKIELSTADSIFDLEAKESVRQQIQGYNI